MDFVSQLQGYAIFTLYGSGYSLYLVGSSDKQRVIASFMNYSQDVGDHKAAKAIKLVLITPCSLLLRMFGASQLLRAAS